MERRILGTCTKHTTWKNELSVLVAPTNVHPPGSRIDANGGCTVGIAAKQQVAVAVVWVQHKRADDTNMRYLGFNGLLLPFVTVGSNAI